MLRDKYAPVIAKSLTPAVTKKLAADVAAFVDRNGEILLSLDFSRRYSFGDQDRQVVYGAAGIDEMDMVQSILASKTIHSENKIQSNPFYATCVLVASHYLNTKNIAMATTVLNYMSMMCYVSIHYGFLQYGANKQAMDYTIEHLDNTFSIRRFPSIYAFIEDNTATVVNTYRTRLMRVNDEDITWVIDAIWTRLKGKLKKISNRYYENHKAGNYLNSDSDSYDSENFHEMDNVSFATARLTNRVYTQLVNRQFDKRFIKYSINNADTSLTKVTNLIEDIIDDDAKDHAMQTLIGSMISFYLQQSGRPISYVAKGDFVVFMKTSFASNTERPEMATIKAIIDKWLADNMYKYGKANYGQTLQTQYRRCLYMFFVFVINAAAKTQ